MVKDYTERSLANYFNSYKKQMAHSKEVILCLVD